MLTKRYPSRTGEEIPAPDEGWWAAVLADEDGRVISPREGGSKPTGQSTLALVDWQRVREIYDLDEIVDLRVQGYNRGGLLVEGDGLQGFVPVSHLVEMPNGVSEEERRTILSSYMGRTLKLKVIECEPDQERVVFSERAALAGEGRRKVLFRALKPGECVNGTVTNVTDFGVFVDLGGLEGLIHVSELSWGRVQHPSDVLTVGEEIDALVLHVSEENARVALKHQAADLQPLGDHPRAVQTRRCGKGGDYRYRPIWRVCPAGGRGRGADPCLLDEPGPGPGCRETGFRGAARFGSRFCISRPRKDAWA